LSLLLGEGSPGFPQVLGYLSIMRIWVPNIRTNILPKIILKISRKISLNIFFK